MKTRFENIKLSVSRGGFSKIGPLKMLADLKTVGSAGRGDNRVMIQKLLVILVLVVFSNGTLGGNWSPANDDGKPPQGKTCLNNTSTRLCGTKPVNIDGKSEEHCFSCPINSYCAPDGKPEIGPDGIPKQGWVCIGNCTSKNGQPTVECSINNDGVPLCCELPEHCIKDDKTKNNYCGLGAQSTGGPGEQPTDKPCTVGVEQHCRNSCDDGFFLCGKSPGLGLSAGPDRYENVCCSNSEMCLLNQNTLNQTLLGKPSCQPIDVKFSCDGEEEFGAAKCCEKGGEKWPCPRFMDCGETKNTCGGNFSFPPKSDFKVCHIDEKNLPIPVEGSPTPVSCLTWNCPRNKNCGKECGQCLGGPDINQISDHLNNPPPQTIPLHQILQGLHSRPRPRPPQRPK